MRTEYPAKVLLAWGEAVDGNVEIRNWLLKNGYPELGLFRAALLWDEKARQWYYDNDHHELIAMIKAVESDKNALSWLRHEGQDVLADMALVGDNNEEAYHRLLGKGHKILALVAKKINVLKNGLDDDRKDPHKFMQR